MKPIYIPLLHLLILCLGLLGLLSLMDPSLEPAIPQLFGLLLRLIQRIIDSNIKNLLKEKNQQNSNSSKHQTQQIEEEDDYLSQTPAKDDDNDDEDEDDLYDIWQQPIPKYLPDPIAHIDPVTSFQTFMSALATQKATVYAALLSTVPPENVQKVSMKIQKLQVLRQEASNVRAGQQSQPDVIATQ